MQVLGPDPSDLQDKKSVVPIMQQENSFSHQSSNSGSNENQTPESLLKDKDNETDATYSCISTTEDLKKDDSDDIPDTRDVVTNNNQIKWNTKRYFRY